VDSWKEKTPPWRLLGSVKSKWRDEREPLKLQIKNVFLRLGGWTGCCSPRRAVRVRRLMAVRRVGMGCGRDTTAPRYGLDIVVGQTRRLNENVHAPSSLVIEAFQIGRRGQWVFLLRFGAIGTMVLLIDYPNGLGHGLARQTRRHFLSRQRRRTVCCCKHGVT